MVFAYDLRPGRQKVLRLFNALRDDIVAGRFSETQTLPGSRALAEMLQISRGTVNMAYAMLSAEGLITIRSKASPQILYRAPVRLPAGSARPVKLSRWAKRLTAAATPGRRPFFATGLLAEEFFPERQWLAAQRRARSAGFNSESSSRGDKALRQAIQHHLRTSRSLDITTDQVIIVNGSMQAITLIAQLLLNEEDSAAFENPGFHGIRSAIHSVGANGIACTVDDEGMLLPKTACRLLFVTPASQFPTGVRMSVSRRSALIDYATRYNAFIVEDEFDSEFSRLPNAPQPLKFSDRAERVIYVGSFSRTMFASLRLGYVVLPTALVDVFLRARELYESVAPALPDQRAMAEFMSRGDYRLHIQRMRKVYSERHDALLHLLRDFLTERWDFTPSAAGLSIYARWKGGRGNFENFQQRLHRSGIGWQPIARYTTGREPLAALFGFAHLNADRLNFVRDRLRALA